MPPRLLEECNNFSGVFGFLHIWSCILLYSSAFNIIVLITVKTTTKSNVVYDHLWRLQQELHRNYDRMMTLNSLTGAQLAVWRHDSLSLILVHEDQEGHHFNWDTTEALTQIFVNIRNKSDKKGKRNQTSR